MSVVRRRSAWNDSIVFVVYGARVTIRIGELVKVRVKRIGFVNGKKNTGSLKE